MKLNKAMDKFVEYLDNEREYSNHTIQNYKFSIEKLSDYFMESYQVIPEVEEIEHDDLRPFLGWLHDSGLSKNSIRLRVASVKSFFKFCITRKYITKNPASIISTPKTEKKLPSYMLKLVHTVNLILHIRNTSFRFGKLPISVLSTAGGGVPIERDGGGLLG
jgi:site-specific recombinase XerD